MKPTCIFCFIILLLSGCSEKEKKVMRETITPEIIIEDLMMIRDPYFLCTDKHIILSSRDNIPGDKFLKVYDLNGTLLDEGGMIGNGPNELNNPRVFLYNENSVFVWDMNLPTAFIYEIDKDGKLTEQPVKHPFSVREIISVQTDKKSNFIVYNPKNEDILTVCSSDGTTIMSGGKLPFPESIKEKDYYYQGEIIYNRYNQNLFLFLRQIPYAAIYKIDDSGITLIHEKMLGPKNYTIADNKMRIETQENCFTDCCFTKDYIVSLKNDPDYTGNDHSRTSPKRHVATLYDYEFNMKKIINLQMVRNRFIAKGNDNTFYAAVENPENSIVKVTLE